METTTKGQAPLSKIVAANVRAEGARRGLTQMEMAKRLGMSRITLSDRYRERTPWTLDEVERLAAFFGVDVLDLVARPKGFEPLTFWLGANHTITVWGDRPGLRAFFCDLCGMVGPHLSGFGEAGHAHRHHTDSEFTYRRGRVAALLAERYPMGARA